MFACHVLLGRYVEHFVAYVPDRVAVLVCGHVSLTVLGKIPLYCRNIHQLPHTVLYRVLIGKYIHYCSVF